MTQQYDPYEIKSFEQWYADNIVADRRGTLIKRDALDKFMDDPTQFGTPHLFRHMMKKIVKDEYYTSHTIHKDGKACRAWAGIRFK